MCISSVRQTDDAIVFSTWMSWLNNALSVTVIVLINVLFSTFKSPFTSKKLLTSNLCWFPGLPIYKFELNLKLCALKSPGIIWSALSVSPICLA